MKIPTWLLSIVIIGGAGWLAWMSVEIIALKVNVGQINQHLADMTSVGSHQSIVDKSNTAYNNGK